MGHIVYIHFYTTNEGYVENRYQIKKKKKKN